MTRAPALALACALLFLVCVPCASQAQQASLSSVLNSFDTSFNTITNEVPNAFSFSDGITGSSISDGGSDMYDGGNILSFVNSGTSTTLAYSDGTITTSAGLGGNQYVTRKRTAIFMLAANLPTTVSSFSITGNVGADGSGFSTGGRVTSSNSQYIAYWRQIYGANDPTVIHVIIMPASFQSSTSQTFSSNTNNEQDTITFTGTPPSTLYYLLLSRQEAFDSALSTSQLVAVLDAFVNNVISTSAWQTMSSIHDRRSTIAGTAVSNKRSGMTASAATDDVSYAAGGTGNSIRLSLSSSFTNNLLPYTSGALTTSTVTGNNQYFTLGNTNNVFISTIDTTSVDLFSLSGTTGVVGGTSSVTTIRMYQGDSSDFFTGIYKESTANNGAVVHLITSLLDTDCIMQVQSGAAVSSNDDGFSVSLTSCNFLSLFTFETTSGLTSSSRASILSSFITNHGYPGGTLTAYVDQTPLTTVLSNILTSSSQLSAAVPGGYTFIGGTSGSSITDGGDDMYDGGNIVSTNFASSIAYTGNSIVTAGGSFGVGGQYFTAKIGPMWILGADMELVTTFSYSGNLGADGSGSYGAFTFSFSGTATSSGTTSTVPWRGWAKSVCGAGDPSVNHLIMAPAELSSVRSATHTVSSNTNLDTDSVSGLLGSFRLMAVTFAGTDGRCYSQQEFMSIADEVMTRSHGGTFSSFTFVTGEGSFGSSSGVDVATIIIAVFASVGGVVVLVIIIFFLIKRRKRVGSSSSSGVASRPVASSPAASSGPSVELRPMASQPQSSPAQQAGVPTQPPGVNPALYQTPNWLREQRMQQVRMQQGYAQDQSPPPGGSISQQYHQQQQQAPSHPVDPYDAKSGSAGGAGGGAGNAEDDFRLRIPGAEDAHRASAQYSPPPAQQQQQQQQPYGYPQGAGAAPPPVGHMPAPPPPAAGPGAAPPQGGGGYYPPSAAPAYYQQPPPGYQPQYQHPPPPQ